MEMKMKPGCQRGSRSPQPKELPSLDNASAEKHPKQGHDKALTVKALLERRNPSPKAVATDKEASSKVCPSQMLLLHPLDPRYEELHDKLPETAYRDPLYHDMIKRDVRILKEWLNQDDKKEGKELLSEVTLGRRTLPTTHAGPLPTMRSAVSEVDERRNDQQQKDEEWRDIIQARMQIDEEWKLIKRAQLENTKR
ncbi:MAG: hypothetical protein Q9171_006778 [Xanthocarpia ochracea]